MKLIAIDMDGTLLSTEHTISKENKEAILEAQKQGNIVAVCSGRALLDIQEIIKQSALDVPIISGNGAIIHNDNILQYLCLPLNVIHPLIIIMDQFQMYFEIYTNEGILVESKGQQILNKEARSLIKLYPDQRSAIERKLSLQNEQYHLRTVPDCRKLDFSTLQPYKIYAFTFDKEKQEKLKSKLAERIDISITSGGNETVEVGNIAVSKGNALEVLADHFRIPLVDTVAIGDHLNDLSMFRVAGTSIAMGNANDYVKSQATYVTTSYYENGVADALKKYVLN